MERQQPTLFVLVLLEPAQLEPLPARWPRVVLLQESLAVRSSTQPECQKTAPAREGR
jgi:hypothetical protein